MSKYKKNKINKNSSSKISLEDSEDTNNNNEKIDDLINENYKSKIKNQKDNQKMEEKDKKQENKNDIINLNSNNDVEELSQSIKNLFLDKDFAAPVVVKKENKLITDYHYVTFKNSYGENTCYINVILHLLHSIYELQEFLSYLYQIDEANKTNDKDNSKNLNDNNDKDTNIKYDNNEFLISLGKILKNYNEIIILNDNDKKKKEVEEQIVVINTLKMRKILEVISDNKFPLNTIADPVEFFTFILDILNENLNGDTHKSFYLELLDEYTCDKKGCTDIKNKYDKDNFMYHIYIDDILNYIEERNIKVNDYRNQLFKISYKSFLSGNIKKCEKCGNEMRHNLICKDCPDYILINCVWQKSNPIIDDVMTILFLTCLKDEFNNLFVYQNRKNEKINYCLFGFILYSFTLSHYIICKYNSDKGVFVLLDDEIVKEYDNLKELISGITVDILKENGKAFFYPVMLIYTKEKLYNYRICKNNLLDENDYQNIINKCNEAINEYQAKSEIGDVIKSDNYQQLIKEQKEIEEKIKKRAKLETEKKRKKEDSKIKIEEDEKKINKENKNEVIVIKEDEEEIKNSKSIKQKEKNKKPINTEEVLIEDEKENEKNILVKKGSKEKNIKEKNNQNNEIKKDNNKNNIQEIIIDNKNKNKTKAKKKKIKGDINEIIWSGQLNQNKKEDNNINNKEEGLNKIYINNSNMNMVKKDSLKKKSVKDKNDTGNSHYLGKKIYNKIEQNEENNKILVRDKDNNFKRYNNTKVKLKTKKNNYY